MQCNDKLDKKLKLVYINSPMQAKKRNIKLIIEYDGTNYRGWQSQSGNHVTVQETIMDVIKQITREKVILYGAGRTDSGVHAIGQVASFYSKTKIPPERLRAALNSNLPKDISIRSVEYMKSSFSAQFQVKTKTYCYTIVNNEFPSALMRNFSYFVSKVRLDTKKMKQAARHLIGTYDFRSFASASRKKENWIRKIYSITIARDKGIIKIVVKGNGFLYNMVRNIVGTLILAGKGSIKPEAVKEILKLKDRRKAGPNVPPQGLCLMKVEY
jgi:tRNA pseudouridine38-40 synthase